MLVSVIIPVYNVEKYLNKCVTSVLNQSYRNIEIILVNDGSTDKSLEICKYFQSTDSRVKVVDKKNGGLSSARNIGLKEAKGDYVLFLDSDDYYDDMDGINQLVLSLNKEKVDVLNFYYKKYFEESEVFQKVFSEVNIEELYSLSSYSERLLWLIMNSHYIASACNKLIKRELLIDNSLFFEDGLLSEDIEWTLKLALCSKSIGIQNLDFYVYRQRENSITHTVSNKHIHDLFYILENLLSIIDGVSDDKLKEASYYYIAYQYGTLLVNVHYASKKSRKKYYKKMKTLSYLLNYHTNKKIYLLSMIKKIFGFRILYFVTYIFSKVR